MKKKMMQVVMVGILLFCMGMEAPLFSQEKEDKAVEAILAKQKAAIDTANDQAVKSLTALMNIRLRSKDQTGVARCEQAIAQVKGEEEDEEGQDTVVAASVPLPPGFEYPEGTFKWKKSRYYVFPKTKWANYAEAEEACKKMGGHLLRIDSVAEFKYFANYSFIKNNIKLRIILEKIDITTDEVKLVKNLNFGGKEPAYRSTTVNYFYFDSEGNVSIPSDINYALANAEFYIICEWN